MKKATYSQHKKIWNEDIPLYYSYVTRWDLEPFHSRENNEYFGKQREKIFGLFKDNSTLQAFQKKMRRWTFLSTQYTASTTLDSATLPL